MEQKQDCPHVDHNQLEPLKSYTPYCAVFVLAKAPQGFKTSYMILNGKNIYTMCMLKHV